MTFRECSRGYGQRPLLHALLKEVLLQGALCLPSGFLKHPGNLVGAVHILLPCM